MNYVRFIVGTTDPDSGAATGILSEFYALRDSGLLYAWEEDRAREYLQWLGENLPAPPFEFRNWPREAICWFREDAVRQMQPIWDVVALLEEHGRLVEIIRTSHPGKILYEDEYQVVADRRYSPERI